MALSIKHPAAVARELARRQGRSITDAIMNALQAELEREKNRIRSPGTAGRLIAIGRRYSGLPAKDERSDDEILGYDEHGIPV